MDQLLSALRAAAEPTRLRLLALAGRGAFCVTEFTEILGQSQPRLSRHLKLLCDSGLLERVREGANVWFAVPQGAAGALSRELIARLPERDPVLDADRRQAARVLAERARAASETFRRQGADWDEMRALDLPAPAVEAALGALVPEAGRLIDIGTGTGRVLELLGARVREGVGIDASKAMLALARARLARAGLSHCSVR
ncbi:MAG: metalloregulator ArsR/SmtB family transcription factor, partial [Acetobacteraceae bacterium]|nr:metalloregulator ArsR/SmtB family transcription factor [Acetobacteraceae bacterium]